MGVARGVLKQPGEAKGVFPLSPAVSGGAFLSSDLRRRPPGGRRRTPPLRAVPALPTFFLGALLELWLALFLLAYLGPGSTRFLERQSVGRS